jgi:hypothetical protein
MSHLRAFPNHFYRGDKSEGMDLRDFFAAHAMQAIITRFPLDRGGWNEELVASSAYFTADAMMKARQCEEGL